VSADDQDATVHDPDQVSESPIGHNDHDKLSWRRWWRRMTGGE
jgi:hypothetical protein